MFLNLKTSVLFKFKTINLFKFKTNYNSYNDYYKRVRIVIRALASIAIASDLATLG